MADQTGRKKLLIVITKSNFGGAQRYVFDLSRSLKESHDLVVAFGGEGLLAEKLKNEGVRTVAIPSLGRDVSVLKDLSSLFSLVSLIRKERPDVIHLNSSKIGVMGAVAAFLARSKARTVFTAHAWAFNEDRNAISKAVIALLHWLTVFLCDKTIAVSDAVRRQIAGFPYIKDKVAVVHLGIDRPVYFGKKNARMLLDIPERSFVVGTIAELHPVKGLSYALKAIDGLSADVKYMIIGEGSERAKLEEQIAKSERLRKSVRLAGFVPDAAQLLPAFDAFLLPSLSEAFGYVLLEAGLAGVPVIASAVGGIPEIVTDMESGILIHPKNVKEIERALVFLSSNKAAREKLGKALKDSAAARFSRQAMVEGTLRVYEGR